MNLQEKAGIAVKAASQKSMAGTIWQKDAGEVRVYLRRTNAARSEAGYIRLTEKDGKGFSGYVPKSGGGPGSRTAAAEGEAVLAHYQSLRKAAMQPAVAA